MLDTPYLPNWPGRLSDNLKEWVTTIRSVVYDDWLQLQIWVDSRLTTAVNALDSRLDTAESDITALEGVDTSLDSRLDTAESTLTSLDSRLDTAESSLTSLDGRLDTLEAKQFYPSEGVCAEAPDGSRTNFTLGGNYTKVVVFVNKQFQRDPADYTRSGTTITLGTAPSTGEVSYLYWP